MKKTLLTVAIAMAMASPAMGHHPAADIVDPEIYQMIDENVSDVHAAMTFDDMGGDASGARRAMESRDSEVGNAGEAPGDGAEDFGAAFSGEAEDVGAAQVAREEMNSMADMGCSCDS